MSKILLIDPDCIKSTLIAGGQGRITWNIASRLAERGHTVTLLTSKYPGYRDLLTEGVNIIHTGLETKNIGINFLSFLICLPFKLIFRDDDVAFECLSAPITTLMSPLFFSNSVIGITAMVEAEIFGKKYHLPLHLWEKFGLKFYKHAVAYSDYYKEKLLSLNPKCKISVITPGISSQFLNIDSTSLPENEYALYIGRIDILQKGLDLLIESVDVNPAAIPNIIIAGFGKESEELELRRLIEAHNLGSKISYVGRVEGEKKIQLLKNASFGIIPSRFETFCVSALEFLALGKRVVYFDIKGLSWIPEYCGDKAKSFDPVDLSRSIQNTNIQPNRPEDKDIIRNFASTMEWEKVVDQYEKLIRNVLNP